MIIKVFSEHDTQRARRIIYQSSCSVAFVMDANYTNLASLCDTIQHDRPDVDVICIDTSLAPKILPDVYGDQIDRSVRFYHGDFCDGIVLLSSGVITADEIEKIKSRMNELL